MIVKTKDCLCVYTTCITKEKIYQDHKQFLLKKKFTDSRRIFFFLQGRIQYNNPSLAGIFGGSAYLGGRLLTAGGVSEHIKLLARFVWALVNVHLLQVNVYPAGTPVTTRRSDHSLRYVTRFGRYNCDLLEQQYCKRCWTLNIVSRLLVPWICNIYQNALAVFIVMSILQSLHVTNLHN